MSEATQLVLAMAHEVGNLLAALRLSTHLLAGELPAEDRQKIARDAEEVAGQAGALLAHLRPLLTDPDPGRARGGAARVVEALGREFEDPVDGPARVAIELPGPDLPEVRADSEALHQVLVTLVLGALHACAPDGRVNLEARSEGDRVIFSIRDGGRPVDVEAIAQGPASRGRELAMRIAKAILERDGGGLSVQSDAAGSHVEIFLPVCRDS